MKPILTFLFLLNLIGLITPFKIEAYDDDWNTFKTIYGKSYSDIEETFRRKVYTENKIKILEHNKLYQQGLSTYALGINEYADLLHHEFSSHVLCLNNLANNNAPNAATFLPPDNIKYPTTVDWRTKGYVTTVKNQGQCGSCWSFSTTGSLEGQHFKKTGNLVSLSEQNLVDCTKSYGNQGCNGGWMNNSFQYIKDNGGIDTETSYPYETKDSGPCRFKKESIGATVTGYTDIQRGSENALQAAVASVGPISVAIHVSDKFQLYSHGVFYEEGCDASVLNHAVLVVGYGTLDGQDHWIVKNSWGPTWGDKGYILMSRNRNNNCGIADAAIYPLV